MDSFVNGNQSHCLEKMCSEHTTSCLEDFLMGSMKALKNLQLFRARFKRSCDTFKQVSVYVAVFGYM